MLLQITPKSPIYSHTNLSNQAEGLTVTHSSSKSRRRHSRTNSGSPRSNGCSRISSSRSSVLVDSETQTDYMEFSENDLSPSNSNTTTIHSNTSRPSQPQRVILQEVLHSSDGENFNGNSIQIHYMAQHTQPC